MHLRLAGILPILTLLAIPARGELPEFPYKAYVTADEVYVRSGPGQNYYPTEKLKMGQEIVIYRHDPGGWYAIRPPKGSFSWVSLRLVEKGKDGLATVTGDRVAARVGSRFSDIRDVVQVRLDRGELVEVLDAGTSTAGDPAERWCKIAPPSGEFRWVHGKYVDPDFPVDGVRKTTADRGPVVQQPAPAAAPATSEPAAPIALQAEAPSAAPLLQDSRQSAAPGLAPAAYEADPSDEGEETSGRPAMRTISPGEFRAEVEDLEMRLSVMVVEEPTAWEFGNLADRARNLLGQAETAVERGRARLLVKKITRLADIQRRYDTVAATRHRVDLARASTADLNRASGQRSAAGQRADRYDGVGRLTRVVSPKVGAPRYALVNQQGDVSCYVTPAPDVNLRPYEGKQIGVTGISGLMLEPRARHVAAKHVQLLDDTRLR